jgi:hypothetical protein
VARDADLVIAGLDPAIHPLGKKVFAKKMDARVTSAFTRVFDALLPAHDEERERRELTNAPGGHQRRL